MLNSVEFLQILNLFIAGLDDEVEFAVLEYWMRLRVPMEQALRLYKVHLAFLENYRYVSIKGPWGPQ